MSDNGIPQPTAGEQASSFAGYAARLVPVHDDSIAADGAGRRPSPWLIALGNFFFKYRDLVSPLVFCGLAFGTRPALLDGSRRLDAAMDGVGLSLGLAGQLLRLLVIGFAYIKRGGKKKRVYADTLVQEGFFAHCRNPLYLGNLLVIVGLAMIHNGVWLYLVGIPFFLLLYVSITTAEEDYLRKKFGPTYEDYCQRVPRFAISFHGLAETLGAMRYDWRKTIRKEYGSVFTFLTLVLALGGWEAIAFDGFGAAHRRIVTLALAWTAIFLAYGAARIAKKTGLLGHD